ncbi:hypothetical protein D3C78_1463030 [compost metagenome]
MLVGAQIKIRGWLYQLLPPMRSIKCFNIVSVISKSAITPSLNGRIATIFPGVRPTIRLASSPTASTRLASLSIATTEGSSRTTPLPLTCISTFAVPKSIPISLLIIKMLPQSVFCGHLKVRFSYTRHRSSMSIKYVFKIVSYVDNRGIFSLLSTFDRTV